MANRVGVVLTTVAGGALAAAGGVGYYDLSTKLAEQQASHTQSINNNNAQWAEKFTKKEADYAKLQAAHSKVKIDLSDLVKKFTTQGADWEKEKQATTNALDNYKNRVLGIEEDVKNVSGRLDDARTQVDDLSSRVDENGQKVGKLESGVASLSGKVGDIEKNYKIVFQNVEGVSSKIDTVTSRVDSLKSDEDRRIEVVSKSLPSVVSVMLNNKGRISRASGFLLENDKGEFIVATAGHVTNTAEEFLNSDFEITFRQGIMLEIQPSKMSNGSVPWSSGNDRDLALIRLPEEVQTFLKKHGVRGLPILSPREIPKDGSNLTVIGSPHGRDWSTSHGIFSKTHFYPWLGKMRRDYQTDAVINGGNSGGPILNNKGQLVGVSSWGDNPKTKITTNDGTPVPLRVNVSANIGLNDLVSNGDVVKALLTWGFKPKGISDEDVKHLVKQDVQDHMRAFAVPMSSGSLFESNVLPYLFSLSRMDGYVFDPSVNKK